MTKPSNFSNWRLDSHYADRLPGLYEFCDPASFSAPDLMQFNRVLAEELGLNVTDEDTSFLARAFAGAELPTGARPLAQAYAGHQFGGFVPQLGDGRALLLGEVVDIEGRRRDIALKGSGQTPYSRGGDGRSAVGPVLREYLIGEAMHALGVPTTRALAAVWTGESVVRDRLLPGAVLTRVAGSHLRVGTFQYFSARGQHEQLRLLADFAIERHDSDLAEQDDRYLLFLQAVVERQAILIARWMSLGFIHGVMNTDNMTISGETIDYGPCAWMEAYSPRSVFSSIDHGGRYAYRNQPVIGSWNLARLAETLLPLIDSNDPKRAIPAATKIIEDFMPLYEAAWLKEVRGKLGLSVAGSSAAVAANTSDDVAGDHIEVDRQLAHDWLDLMEKYEVDFTLGWRRLADAAEGETGPLARLFASEKVIHPWLQRWRQRLAGQSVELTASTIRSVSPIYVPRNHLVEESLAAASKEGDLKLFERLLAIITSPYEERAELADYAQPAPNEYTACYKTFCGT